jgi:hypothetical protein
MAVSVDPFLLNPCCSTDKILFRDTCAYNLLKITFSNILEKDVNTEIGPYFEISTSSPFLYIACICEYFSPAGNIPVDNALLHI